MPVTHIPEDVVLGKRLGRNIEHDDRSRAYIAAKATAIVSVQHAALGLPLDQGDLGSCTAEALIGALNTQPNLGTSKPWTQPEAYKLYQREARDEGYRVPPDDPGGSGLAVCKAAKEMGLISSYTHTFSLDTMLRALVIRPVIIGINW